MKTHFPYLLLLFIMASFTLQAQSSKELDDYVVEKIGPYRDQPKEFYKKLQELEESPDFDFQQSAKANFFMGYCYAVGHGIFTDRKQSHTYYRRAGELGERDGYYMIAVNYATYEPQNRQELEEQIEVNQKGAAMGVTFCMWQLFFLHRDGEGSLQKNPEKGVEWLKKAAYQGQPNACVTLAELYKKGKWVDKDQFMAFKLMKEAALLDHEEAYIGMFKYYRDGIGIGQSCEKALEWLQKGLEEREAAAQYYKAMTYLEEKCAPENDEEAKKWLRLAAAQKYQPAVRQLEHLENYQINQQRREQQAQWQQEMAPSKPNNPSTNNSQWTYQNAIEYYKNELAQWGKIYHGSVEQGSSYSCEFSGHGDHIVRLVVNEGTLPGYYPVVKIIYYDSSKKELGSYTSTSANVKRIHEHLTVLEFGVGDLPYSVDSAQFKLVRGSGYLISVLD